MKANGGIVIVDGDKLSIVSMGDLVLNLRKFE
jgi:hypothetical protein